MRQVFIYRGEDGYWIAECSSLPGCIITEDGLPVPEEHFKALLLAIV